MHSQVEAAVFVAVDVASVAEGVVVAIAVVVVATQATPLERQMISYLQFAVEDFLYHVAT